MGGRKQEKRSEDGGGAGGVGEWERGSKRRGEEMKEEQGEDRKK